MSYACNNCALFIYRSHTTYTKMCRLLLIDKTCWCHHTILWHIYDVTTFQSIVMSQSYLSNVCCWCCHDTIVDVNNNNEMLMATDGRSLHCGDLHHNIPWNNSLVVPVAKSWDNSQYYRHNNLSMSNNLHIFVYVVLLL